MGWLGCSRPATWRHLFVFLDTYCFWLVGLVGYNCVVIFCMGFMVCLYIRSCCILASVERCVVDVECLHSFSTMHRRTTIESQTSKDSRGQIIPAPRSPVPTMTSTHLSRQWYLGKSGEKDSRASLLSPPPRSRCHKAAIPVGMAESAVEPLVSLGAVRLRWAPGHRPIGPDGVSRRCGVRRGVRRSTCAVAGPAIDSTRARV
jgi:hypothetical protein